MYIYNKEQRKWSLQQRTEKILSIGGKVNKENWLYVL